MQSLVAFHTGGAIIVKIARGVFASAVAVAVAVAVAASVVRSAL